MKNKFYKTYLEKLVTQRASKNLSRCLEEVRKTPYPDVATSNPVAISRCLQYFLNIG